LKIGDAIFIFGRVIGQKEGAAGADEPENLLDAGARAVVKFTTTLPS